MILELVQKSISSKSLFDSVSIETIVLLEYLKLFYWNQANEIHCFTASNARDHSLNMQGLTNHTEYHLDQNHRRREHPVTDTLNFYS